MYQKVIRVVCTSCFMLLIIQSTSAQPVGVDPVKPIPTPKKPAVNPDPPPSPAPQSPQIALLGDHKKATNSPVVIIKTTGSIGDDPQITVTPASNNWQALKTLDDELVVMFFEQKPGTYVIAFALNKNGKTALAAHDITVGDPAPVPGPPAPVPGLTQSLQAAYNTDGANAQAKVQLIALYKEMANVSTGTWGQLQSLLQATSTKMVATALPSVRTAATKHLASKFPGTGIANPIDPVLVKTTFTELADALSGVTP